MDTTDRPPEIEPWEAAPPENTDEGWGTLSNWVAEQSEDHSEPAESSWAPSRHPRLAAAGIAALLFAVGILTSAQFASSGSHSAEETAISDAPEEMAEPPSTDIQNVSPALEQASDDADISKI